MALQIGYHKIHESGIGFCTRDFEDNATRITLEITFALKKLEKNSRNLIFDGVHPYGNVYYQPENVRDLPRNLIPKYKTTRMWKDDDGACSVKRNGLPVPGG